MARDKQAKANSRLIGGGELSGVDRHLLDAIDDGIFILDDQFNIVFANQWLSRRFSHAAPLEGRPCWQVLQGGDGPCLWCPLREVMDNGNSAAGEVPLTVRGEQVGWLELSARALPEPGEGGPRVLVHAKDVTKEKTAQLSKERQSLELMRSNQELSELKSVLQASRNKLKAVFDAIVEPVFSVSPEGLLESVNLAAAQLADSHPRELAGQSLEDFMERLSAELPLGADCLEGFHLALRSGQFRRRLVSLPAPDGTRYFDLFHTPVSGPHGVVVLVIVQVKDVTNYKRMEITIREYSQSLEERVAQRTRELTKANQELKRLDKLRRDLFNMVVHDMKSPLAELMGNLDMLTYGEMAEGQREVLDMAVMGGEDLLRMIMNLLDIERMEEERMPLRPEELRFAPVAEEVRSRFVTMIRLKQMEVEISETLEAPFPADPEVLGRVLQNLLTNALHHTDEGGWIAMKAEPGEDGGVLISVADNGPGIAADKQEMIFTKFTQAENDGGPRTSTGLGLTFCKMAVESHGGRIWVASEPGQGTTFFTWLPGTAEEDDE